MKQHEVIDLHNFIDECCPWLRVLAMNCDSDGDWFLLVARGEDLHASQDERNLLRYAIITGGDNGNHEGCAH